MQEKASMQAFILLILYGIYIGMSSLCSRHRIVPYAHVRCHAIKEGACCTACALCADMPLCYWPEQRSCLNELNRRSIRSL